MKLNLDYSQIRIDKLLFQDRSLNDLFQYDLNDVSAEITHFPSTVYPSGDMVVSGRMQNRNPFEISSKIGTETGYQGSLKISSLRAADFSPYLEKFTGYQVLSGQADIGSSFKIGKKDLELDTGAVFNRLRLRNLNDRSGIRLDQIIEQIEDPDHNIRLTLPVKGSLNQPDIDYYRIFFRLLYDTIAGSSSPSKNKTEKYSPESQVDLVYFKGGSSDFAEAEGPVFSKKLLEEMAREDKIIVIEAYVDRALDGEYLKRTVLKELIRDYSRNGESDEQILSRIYQDLTGEVLNSDDSPGEKVLKVIKVTDKDFETLAYRRAQAVKNFLTDRLNINQSRIMINMTDIDRNPYMSGMSQMMAAVYTDQ
jgi:hypothetical protein